MASKSSPARPEPWRPEPSRPEPPGDEERVVGVHACQALAAVRPDDVLRVYLTEAARPLFVPLLHHCAANRRPYRFVESDDLDRLAESTHHEGICILARRRQARPLAEILAQPGPGWLVATADVGNPHNVGAILRSAAHFGARAVLLGGASPRGLSTAAYRTAQGGAEYVDALPIFEPTAALTACRRAGFTVCATSSHRGRDPFEGLPARTVLLFGAEGDGLSDAELRAADEVVRVPGTGNVESLNVAVTVGVLLAELWRQHAR